jgi:hypothetical protein
MIFNFIKSKNRSFGVIVLLFLSFCFLTWAEESKEVPKTTSTETASPYTNSVPVSVFHEMEGKDPFLPSGYRKPKPMDPVQDVDVELIISGTSFSSEGIPMATTKDGLFLEIGNTYTYRTKDGKSATYKVINITEEGVVISFNEKEKTFRLESSDLEKFKEKEEAP